MTVGGIGSNGVTFTVGSTGTVSGTVSKASDGSPVSGALVEALQSGVVKGSATTAGNGTYSIGHLLVGTYDLRASAGGYTSQTQNGIAVSAAATTTVNFSLNQAGTTAGIVYIYDRLSRLRAVVDLASDTGIYNYDAVGNLLSIARQNSSVVSIIEISTTTGPAGTTVTIFGTGFSGICGQNTVTFNGTAATILSCTATQIVTTVPTGATTGPIVVTNAGGSASSNGPFTVSPSTGGPVITGFTPTIGTPGTPVTISGANFDSSLVNNHVRFNNVYAPVTSATSTSIVAAVPSRTGSGRISVTTPMGKVTSSADFFIPPPPSFFVPPPPYTAADVDFAGRITIGGPSLTVTISTANKIGLLVFDGTAGQNVSLGVNAGTLSSATDLVVFKPDGTEFDFSPQLHTLINRHMTLPETGTYSILIDPDGASTGSVTLTLSEELTGGIAIGGASVTVTVGRVGQRARLNFAASEMQRINLGVNSTTLSPLSDLAIERERSNLLASLSLTTDTNLHLLLWEAGTYEVLIDPDSTSTGSVTLTLSEEINAGVTINGPSVNISIARVGQRARITFDGTAGQQATVQIAGNTMGMVNVQLLKPDGLHLTAANSSAGSFNLPTQTLPLTGTYTIFVDPPATNTGSMNLSVTNP